jgi:hypothetical protein
MDKLGILAFVAIIGTAALIAYKLKDTNFAGVNSTIDKVNAILNPLGSGAQAEKKPFDFITIAVILLLVFSFIQVARLKGA